MIVRPIKTHKITLKDKNLFKILDKYLPKISEKTILAVTSKIISITEGRVVKIGTKNKEELAKEESEYYLPQGMNPYRFTLSIKDSTFIASGGVDESNGNGYYILWPKDPQKSANDIRQHLVSGFNLNNVGVIITDSKTTPLRWGVTGVGIAHSGFFPLNDYVGKPDVFGRKLQVTKGNVLDALASAAVIVMGEGSEQTPLALIEDVPFVQFQNRNPTQEELAMLKISIDEDLYSPLLKSVKWKKGKSK